ncbi:unnamed protein product [Urochloa decumbens]|uniref:Uncharacterized protein n=1 Tax=Urochloa decumbens TaxID=240449 RepID=A0ABC8ZHY6_9POAL
MGISNRLRPALGRITSSVASTASYGITRVISFTDSFNERTSLLLDVALAHEEEPQQPDASPSAGQEHDAAPALTTAIVSTFDIEAAATPATRSSIHGRGGGGQEPPAAAAQDAESKRVAKVVQTVCIFGASASLLLFVNPPRRHQGPGGGGGAMYRAHLFFVCLGLFASLGLSMFSIIVARPGEPAVARVQKWGMVAAVASVLAASALRMAVMLPVAASLESAWVAAFVLTGVVGVYLSLAWKFGGGRQQAEASSSCGSDHGAGGVADPV